MHNCSKDITELFNDLLENSTPIKNDFNLKNHTNKGYSFPRYISKYKGFNPSDHKIDHKKNSFYDSTNYCNNQITSKDVKRIINNNENIHNYFMEYQKDHFYSFKLCNFKIIERILLYYETSLSPSDKEVSSAYSTSSTEKENLSNKMENSSNIKDNVKEYQLQDRKLKEHPHLNKISKDCPYLIKTLKEPYLNKNLKDCSYLDKISRECHNRLKANSKSSFLKSTGIAPITPVDFKYKINIDDISNGKDKRTTCMIKNIPNKYTQQMLIELLNEHHFGCYDFVYLRMDFKNKCNVGYAFVNLISSECVISLYQKINSKGWKKFFSNKIAQVTYASIQSLENLKKKFRKSSVMQEQESYRPKLFYSDGPLRGYEQTDF